MIELYLLAKDFRTMLDGVTYPGDDLELQDWLGWDRFVKGRISKSFWNIEAYHSLGGHLPLSWVSGASTIEHLLQLTSGCFKTLKKYFRRLDGFTEVEHTKIFQEMQRTHAHWPSWFTPTPSTPDVNQLWVFHPSSIPRLHWNVSIGSAIKASDCVRREHLIPGSLGQFMTPNRICVAPWHSSTGRTVYRHTTRHHVGWHTFFEHMVRSIKPSTCILSLFTCAYVEPGFPYLAWIIVRVIL